MLQLPHRIMDEASRRRRVMASLSSLRVFEAVARHASFTQAAAELGIAQSAASRQVRSLEKVLDVPLLWRTTRQVEVTEQGRFYAQLIRGALDTIEAGTQELIGGRKGAVVLAIGAPAAFSMRWLVPRLRDFQARHPDILLKLIGAEDAADALRQKIDLVISFGDSGGWRKAEVEALFSEPMAVVCSPSLLEGPNPPVTVEALKYHRLLHTFMLASSWERWLQQAGSNMEFPRGGAPMEDLFLVIQAAVVGLGIALLPLALVRDELAKGLLVAPFARPGGPDAGAGSIPDLREAFFLIVPRQKTRLYRVRVFREWLHEQIGRKRTIPAEASDMAVSEG